MWSWMHQLEDDDFLRSVWDPWQESRCKNCLLHMFIQISKDCYYSTCNRCPSSNRRNKLYLIDPRQNRNSNDDHKTRSSSCKALLPIHSLYLLSKLMGSVKNLHKHWHKNIVALCYSQIEVYFTDEYATSCVSHCHEWKPFPRTEVKL